MVIVIIVFLQSWRMAIVPIVAIPVSLIGTLAVLLAFDFSLNMLTLFGLVLAIGIVVDDAIVVVENVERNIASGMSPNLAAHRTMDEVGTAVIGISLVLIAVFVPTAFIPGISGQFYLQFAITIAVSTAISAFNSLTLSPALAALLFKPHHDAVAPPRFFLARFGRTLADGFNRGFDRLAHFYAGIVRFLVGSWIALVATLAVFAGLIFATVYMAQSVPTRLHPDARPGLCDRRHPVARRRLAGADRRGGQTGLGDHQLDARTSTNAVAFAGFSGATFTNASNAGVIFAAFDPFEERLEAGQSAAAGDRRPVRPAAEHPRSLHHRAAAAPDPRRRQCRRLQDPAAGAQQRRCPPDLAARLRDRRQGQPDAGTDRGLHHLLGVEPAILPGDRSRQGAYPQRSHSQHLRDAVDQSRHGLCQRFQRVRSRLPGAGAGRPAIPARPRRHPETEGALGDRRAGAARHADRDPRRHRSGAGAALQHVRLGAAAGQRRARSFDGPGAGC